MSAKTRPKQTTHQLKLRAYLHLPPGCRSRAEFYQKIADPTVWFENSETS